MVNLCSNAINFQTVYSIKSYIGITMSMCLTLSICFLFISLMELVSREPFLVIIFFLLFADDAATMFRALTIALKSIYT